MNIYDAAFVVIDALESAQIPYMLSGSLASMYYGISRSTVDADFVVHFGTTSVSEVVRRLGPQFRFDAQMSFETITGTTRNVVDVVDTPFKIELFRLGSDAHDQERFARRRIAKIAGRDVCLPTAEDVIVTKLRWARRKDLEDVRDVIAVQGDAIDWNYVCRWCDVHGTRGRLDQIRGEIPKI